MSIDYGNIGIIDFGNHGHVGSRRGFGVAVPGFKRAYVNSEIYKREYSELSGFAKLLFLELRDHYIDNYGYLRGLIKYVKKVCLFYRVWKAVVLE